MRWVLDVKIPMLIGSCVLVWCSCLLASLVFQA